MSLTVAEGGETANRFSIAGGVPIRLEGTASAALGFAG
jgi:hypothetical protein